MISLLARCQVLRGAKSHEQLLLRSRRSPLGLFSGEMEEVATSKEVAARSGRRRFRSRPPRTGFIQVSLNRRQAMTFLKMCERLCTANGVRNSLRQIRFPTIRKK